MAPARVAGLVLLCPVPAAGLPLPEPTRKLFHDAAGNHSQQRTILQMACRELTEAARERLLDLAASIPAACLHAGLEAWSRGGFADRLAALCAPTLVVATNDPFLPPSLLATAVVAPIARARLAVLPGPGHYPQVERPRETAALLQAFLAGLARP
ncbi:MAG: alpha/beta hydrolase [Myxococcales bacterium]|nr:alpha/beta hydrolase [Myxococcota bacterium]MDW8283540.1 alpha/beta hydrolase [Myxococcales bacterium]